MIFPNADLIFNIILPSLISSTLFSVLSAFILGGVVGFLVGAIARQPKRTVLPAIIGCFFGVLLVCMVPIVSTPGIVGGGPYAGIIILAMMAVLLPTGVLAGSLAGSLLALRTNQFDLHQLQPQQFKRLLAIVAIVYVLAFGIMYVRITIHCLRPNTLPLYCAEAGFPNELYP